MAYTLLTGVDYSAAPDDAWFRGFKRLSDALTAVGFLCTGDGQVDWSAALASTGAFEIRAFPGAEVTPVFVRIGYTVYGLSVQLGTGTDGAGNLTGAGTNPVLSVACLPDGPGTGKTAWALSSDDYGFALISGGGAEVSRYFLAVESLRDDAGTPLDGLATVLRSRGPGLGECDGTWFDLAAHTHRTYRSLPINYFDTVTALGQSSNYSGSYYFSAPLLITPAGVGRTRMLLGLNQNDFPPGAVLAVPRLGQDFTDSTSYLFYKPESGPGGFGSSDYAYCAPALYWA